MKVKAVLALSAVDAIHKILEGNKLPVSLAFKLSRVKKKLLPIAEEFEAQRLELAKRLGTPAEAEGTYHIPPENIDSFNAQLKELIEQEEEVSDLLPIPLYEFGEIYLESTQVDIISWLIEE